MTLSSQLREYIAAAFPGIYISSFEHDDANLEVNAQGTIALIGTDDKSLAQLSFQDLPHDPTSAEDALLSAEIFSGRAFDANGNPAILSKDDWFKRWHASPLPNIEPYMVARSNPPATTQSQSK